MMNCIESPLSLSVVMVVVVEMVVEMVAVAVSGCVGDGCSVQ
jgi:hypothetical protein